MRLVLHVLYIRCLFVAFLAAAFNAQYTSTLLTRLLATALRRRNMRVMASAGALEPRPVYSLKFYLRLGNRLPSDSGCRALPP